jgi:hypothetical protein
VINNPLTYTDPSGFMLIQFCPTVIDGSDDSGEDRDLPEVGITSTVICQEIDLPDPDFNNYNHLLNTPMQTPKPEMTPLSPPNYACLKFAIDCDLSIPPTQICFGSFTFAGTETDAGEGEVFVGAIVESTLSGIDPGSLYEGSVGGEGGAAGVTYTGSFSTGNSSAFGFVGASVSAGPLAGGQAGTFLAPSNGEFGVYLEGHRGTTAGGVGFGSSNCKKSSGQTSGQPSQ